MLFWGLIGVNDTSDAGRAYRPSSQSRIRPRRIPSETARWRSPRTPDRSRHRRRSQRLKVLAGTLPTVGYDLASPDLTGVDVYQVGLHPDRPPRSSRQTRPDTSCPAAVGQYRCRKAHVRWGRGGHEKLRKF